jgi:hypothetical protein
MAKGAKSRKNVDPERSSAMKGNNNASKKNISLNKVILANVGGVATGLLQSPAYSAKSAEVYKKYGAGSIGHGLGVGVRRLTTLDFKKY